MLYVVTNISDVEIPIGKGFLKPGKEMETFNLEPFKKLIETGVVKARECEYIIPKEIIEDIKISTEEKQLVKPESENQVDFIKENLKHDLVESCFNLYLHRDLSEKDLRLLKWFYKNIALTNKVKPMTLSLLDSVENYDDFIEVLLNNVYPELFELYLTHERKK